MAPVAVVERTSCSFDCPAMLAERRPRRTRTSLCSNMRRLLRRSAALLGTANGASSSLRWRPSMASLGARPICLLRRCVRAGSAQPGAPRTRRAGDGKVRRMAHRMCASSPQVHGWTVGEPRRPLAHPEHRDVLRTGSRGGLSLGDFSLAKQREATRAPGRGAEKDMDVERRYAQERSDRVPDVHQPRHDHRLDQQDHQDRQYG